MKSPNCGVEGSHSPNEQDPKYNEDGFRAKYSRKIYSFSLRQRPVEFTPDLPIKKCPNLTVCTLFSYKVTSNLKKSRSCSSSFLFLLNLPLYMFQTARSPVRKKTTTNTIESSHSRAG